MRIESVGKDFGGGNVAAVFRPGVAGWPLALPVLGVALLALLGLYGQTAVSMASIWWRSDTFAHGMLVAPIAGYMIWLRRRHLASLQPRSDWRGLAVLLLLCLNWLAAHAAGVLVVQQLVLVAMVPALSFALLGGQVVRTIAFPLAYLFFAVPMGEALVSPMQDFTAWFTVKALQLTGIPVYWEGRHLMIPSGNFEVAEACSGLRYLIASLALGCLYAYLSYRSLRRRLAFVALAILVPVIANGLRAYSIVMLAHLSDHRLAVGVDHLIYGWVFFGVVIFLLFWIGSWWREPPEEVPGAEAPPAPGGTARRSELLAVCVAAVLVAASGPLGAAWLDVPSDATAPVALAAPAAPAPWSGPQEPSRDDWEPRFKGADALLHGIYRLEGKPVHLYVAYYQRQRQGAELVNSQNSLYDDRRWTYLGAGRKVLAEPERSVNELRIGSAGQRRLVWHWYQIAGRRTTSPVAAKLLQAWDRLGGRRQGGALIAVGADYEIAPDEAEVLIRRFLDAMEPAIERTLEPQG